MFVSSSVSPSASDAVNARRTVVVYLLERDEREDRYEFMGGEHRLCAGAVAGVRVGYCHCIGHTRPPRRSSEEISLVGWRVRREAFGRFRGWRMMHEASAPRGCIRNL